MFRENLIPSWKIQLARKGDAKVFGEDSDVKRGMNDDQALKRFAKVWKETLEPAVRIVEQITTAKANSSVDVKQKKYAVDGFQFRQFSIDAAVFIVCLNEGAKDDGVCTQLWPLGAHRDTTRLCMYFGTVAEKEFFEQIAKKLNYTEAQDLALELTMDFLRKFPGFLEVMKKAVSNNDE